MNFPAQYANDYFYADFCAGWIKSVDLTTKAESTLLPASGSRSPVDIDVADDGSLYYLARGQGQVHRVRFVDSGTPPSISTHPQPVTVPVGGNATFTVSASGSAPLTYRWQRNGADIPGATGSSYTLNGAQTADSGAQFRVIVSNASGSATSNAAALTVTSNQPPVPTISAPATGARYSAGDTISFAGSATDPEDGTLGGARFTWRIDFHHADHVHPFLQPASGSTSGSFAIPTTGHTDANVWYRVHLTVRDSGGLEASTFRDVQPRTARVTLATSVPGLQLELDDQPVTAPHAHTGVVGMQRKIAAPSPQVVGGRVYIFTLVVRRRGGEPHDQHAGKRHHADGELPRGSAAAAAAARADRRGRVGGAAGGGAERAGADALAARNSARNPGAGVGARRHARGRRAAARRAPAGRAAGDGRCRRRAAGAVAGARAPDPRSAPRRGVRVRRGWAALAGEPADRAAVAPANVNCGWLGRRRFGRFP